MSELRIYRELEDYLGYDGVPLEMYDKQEADKVIAELTKKLDLYKRGFKEDDKINAYLYVELRHQKYKRCLAMALLCFTKGKEKQSGYKLRTFFWSRWGNRWSKLAEKFKEFK